MTRRVILTLGWLSLLAYLAGVMWPVLRGSNPHPVMFPVITTLVLGTVLLVRVSDGYTPKRKHDATVAGVVVLVALLWVRGTA